MARRHSQHFCAVCGTLLIGDHDTCLHCGTRLKDGVDGPIDVPPPQDSRYGLISTWNWFGAMLLMMIPGVNLVMLILWACGKCTHKLQRRNFARGALLALAVLLVIFMLVFSTTLLVVLRRGMDPVAYFSFLPGVG